LGPPLRIAAPAPPMVSSDAYCATWSGHDVGHLLIAHDTLRRRHSSLIFLAGDSSLDNKAWVKQREPSLNGYEDFLQQPTMKADVCYWLNSEAMRRGETDLACINTAIEATTLAERSTSLLPQDRFVHDHITAQDYLVVSIGGNDIALRPSNATIFNMLVLLHLVPQMCIDYCSCVLPLGAVLPPGLGHFVRLFGAEIQRYVVRLLGDARPRKVVVCMLYFLDEAPSSSWAGRALAALRYDRNPGKLQAAIRAVFRLATRRVRVPGTEVVACPLFEALDGKTTEDYTARVEPSASGGKKMATLLMEHVLGEDKPKLA